MRDKHFNGPRANTRETSRDDCPYRLETETLQVDDELPGPFYTQAWFLALSLFSLAGVTSFVVARLQRNQLMLMTLDSWTDRGHAELGGFNGTTTKVSEFRHTLRFGSSKFNRHVMSIQNLNGKMSQATSPQDRSASFSDRPARAGGRPV